MPSWLRKSAAPFYVDRTTFAEALPNTGILLQWHDRSVSRPPPRARSTGAVVWISVAKPSRTDFRGAAWSAVSWECGQLGVLPIVARCLHLRFTRIHRCGRRLQRESRRGSSSTPYGPRHRAWPSAGERYGDEIARRSGSFPWQGDETARRSGSLSPQASFSSSSRCQFRRHCGPLARRLRPERDDGTRAAGSSEDTRPCTRPPCRRRDRTVSQASPGWTRVFSGRSSTPAA